MKTLLEDIYAKNERTVEDMIEFCWKFECINPFQYGYCGVVWLILSKECMANNMVPIIVAKDFKLFYYRDYGNGKMRTTNYLTPAMQLRKIIK